MALYIFIHIRQSRNIIIHFVNGRPVLTIIIYTNYTHPIDETINNSECELYRGTSFDEIVDVVNV